MIKNYKKQGKKMKTTIINDNLIKIDFILVFC